MWQSFSTTVRELLKASEPSVGSGSYRADLHYMRGPGPKWRAKHAGFLAFDTPQPALAAAHCQTPKRPRCPCCAQPMPLVRSTQRFGGLPTPQTFECRHCDVAFSREAVLC